VAKLDVVMNMTVELITLNHRIMDRNSLMIQVGSYLL